MVRLPMKTSIARSITVFLTLFSAASAFAAPSLYKEDARTHTGKLTIRALNFPDSGSYAVLLATDTGAASALAVGTALTVTRVKPVKPTTAIPASYDATTRTIVVPIVVTKIPTGWAYHDVTLVADTAAVGPL